MWSSKNLPPSFLPQGVEHLEVRGHFDFGYQTKAHKEHSDRNEDRYFVDVNNLSLGVFDGVGGNRGSELAAEIANVVSAKELARIRPIQEHAEARRLIGKVIMSAQDAIISSTRDLYTTATIAKVFETPEGTPFVAIASASDSRAYVLRGSVLHPQTNDFGSLGNKANAAKQDFLSQVRDPSKLKGQSEVIFSQRHVAYNLLGQRHGIDIASTVWNLIAGDTILLTTDGVHDNLTDDEIKRIGIRAGSPSSLTSQLVDAASARSLQDKKTTRAKADDITAVALKYES